jgi:hypothetical protein
VVLRTLTAEEKEARDRALAGARVREAEDRKRQEEDAKRRAEQDARDLVDREAAAKRKAEDDARHRIEEEARRKADEAAKKLAPKSAQSNVVTPATEPMKAATGRAAVAPVKRTHDEEETAPRRTFAPPFSLNRSRVRPMKLSFVVMTHGAMNTKSSRTVIAVMYARDRQRIDDGAIDAERAHGLDQSLRIAVLAQRPRRIFALSQCGSGHHKAHHKARHCCNPGTHGRSH